jgi:hypothetical protein
MVLISIGAALSLVGERHRKNRRALRESCVIHICQARAAPSSCEVGMITLHPWRRPMERMEHIRGKILNGEQTVIEQLDGYLAQHDHKGHKTLFGYFERPTEDLKVLNHETCYKLVLSDGRKANIYTEIVPSNVAGKSVAEFHISGPLKK